MRLPKKVTNEDIDFLLDFSNWGWFQNGDAITGGAATVKLGDVEASITATTGSTATLRLTGGTAGKLCEVLVTVTTQNGRTLTEPCFVDVIG